MIEPEVLRQWFREELALRFSEGGRAIGDTGGRVFTMPQPLTMEDLLIAAAERHGWDREALAELPDLEDILHGSGIEDLVGDAPPDWAVECGNPGGLFCIWGLMTLRAGNYGLFFSSGDDLEDYQHQIFAAWTPVACHDAFREAFLDAYEASWNVIGLPPVLGECAEDYTGFVPAALERVIQHNPTEAWECIAHYFDMNWDKDRVYVLKDPALDASNPGHKLLAELTGAQLADRIRNGQIDPAARQALVQAFLAAVMTGVP